MRIAFDLDGTLADLDSALDRVARELFAPETSPVPPGASDDEAEAVSPEEEQLEPPEVRALTRRQQRRVWDAVRTTADFWETLDETEPGIVARIAADAEAGRWEVIFLTQRPGAAGGTTQRQTQRWLERFGFEMPSVFVLDAGASRGKVAAALALDVVVDDRTENVLDVKSDSGARAFLVSRAPSPTLAANARRLGIEVVESTGRCLDVLAAEAREKRGLFGRLRKMIES